MSSCGVSNLHGPTRRYAMAPQRTRRASGSATTAAPADVTGGSDTSHPVPRLRTRCGRCAVGVGDAEMDHRRTHDLVRTWSHHTSRLTSSRAIKVVAASGQADRVAVASQRSAMEIPADVGGITPDWLTSCLQGGGFVKQARVASIDVRPVGFKGMTGQISQLLITYDQNEHARAVHCGGQVFRLGSR